jgi:glycosyltransferase involved in cell wall biosynthesis
MVSEMKLVADAPPGTGGIVSRHAVLTVIIPALNEADSLPAVLGRIPNQIDGIQRVQCLVIDDGSTDETRNVALAAGADVVSHHSNLGLGRAFATGLDQALRRGSDVIVSLDADGQHPPEDIPRLIGPILNGGSDVVLASRFSDPDVRPDMPWVKRMGNAAMARITSLAAGIRLSDAACGFRAYSREAALRLNSFGTFTYTQETIVDLAHQGLRISELPVRVRGVREHGESRIASNVWSYARRTLMILLPAVRDRLPLVFFGTLGTLSALFGLALLTFVSVHFLLEGRTSPYQSLIVLGGTFLVLGAVTYLIALLAGMLARVRMHVEALLYYEKKAYYESLSEEREFSSATPPPRKRLGV